MQANMKRISIPGAAQKSGTALSVPLTTRTSWKSKSAKKSHKRRIRSDGAFC
jgi:hypothetical protein